MFSPLPKYSHIYVEERAAAHPNTSIILSNMSRASVIPIRHYSEVFNRGNQRWKIQKELPKIILAIRDSEFLYEGSPLAPSFGAEHFYYNSLVMNCPYDCEYCYLQGMYSSGHVVMFVNNEDFQNATSEKLSELGSLYLCISYDSDLLALEGIFPFCSSWISFTKEHPELTIEIRTKSANSSPFVSQEPCERVVLAWTISPEEYVNDIEHGTARLSARLKAVEKVLSLGWKVRLCFDPVILLDSWKENYSRLTDQLAQSISLKRISQFAVGTFRMPEGYFKKSYQRRPHSRILAQRYETSNGAVGHPEELQQEARAFVRGLLSQHVDENRIFLC
ncbi:MAG: hypothetical protein KDD64_07335 [Bdellovibrionales bacterium]|nr:hypothetical protein [Bdellovibrionales bacterium]